jgi:hypothetical protein
MDKLQIQQAPMIVAAYLFLIEANPKEPSSGRNVATVATPLFLITDTVNPVDG